LIQILPEQRNFENDSLQGNKAGDRSEPDTVDPADDILQNQAANTQQAQPI
jgi:hypothetical protein